MSIEREVYEWARGLGFPAAVAWYVLRYLAAEMAEVRRLLAVLVDRQPKR